MAQTVPRLLTEAEYLAFERAAETRHELEDGVLIDRAGSSIEHNRVVVNLIGVLVSALRGRPCEAFPSAMRVRAAQGRYYYPDVTVVCGKPEIADDKRDILLNPSAIFEVLSESTEARDRGKKLRTYTSMPSFTDYFLCSTEEPVIEHYTRAAEGLLVRHYFAGQTFSLRGPDARLAVDEIYRGVFE